MIKTILVPIDFSDVTDVVLAVAGRFAKAFEARILLTHVATVKVDVAGFELCPQYVGNGVARQLGQEDRTLHEYEKTLRAEGLEVTAMLASGPAVHEIAEEAESLKPDLVILGSHSHGVLHHLFTSSVLESMLKHARCPVVIVPRKTTSP